MGKYDINSEFSEDYKLNIYELAKELSDEFNDDAKDMSVDGCLKKLKGRAGIVNRLKEKLDFDIEAIAGDKKYERFKMLQILKILFKVEKTQNCSVVKLLASPHLENMKNEYSDESKNGDLYAKIYYEIMKLVPDAVEREEKIKRSNFLWEELTGLLRLCISTPSNKNMLHTLLGLKKVEQVVNDILQAINSVNPKEIKHHDGVAESMFNMLVCHQVISNDTDKIHMNKSLGEIETPCIDYIERYKKEYYTPLKKSDIVEMESKLKGKDSDFGDKIWDLITYDNFNKDDMKSYRYAVKNYRSVLEYIFRSVKNNLNDESDGFYNPYSEPVHQYILNYCKNEIKVHEKPIEECTNIGLLVAVMQELIYIHKNKISFENRFYRYCDVGKPLTARINNETYTEAAAIRFIVRRVENRRAANSGKYNFWKMVREIENKIYEVKKFIFSYYSIDDFCYVGEKLYQLIWRVIVGINVTSEDMKSYFVEDVGRYIENKNIGFFIPFGKRFLIDMMAEFNYDIVGIKYNLAKRLADIINSFYSKDDTFEPVGIKILLTTNDDDLFAFECIIDKRNNLVAITDFYSGVNPDDSKRMRELGLNNLIGRYYKQVDVNEAIEI